MVLNTLKISERPGQVTCPDRRSLKNKGHACLSSCTRLFLFIFFEIQLLLFVFIKKLSISVLGEREPGGSLRRIPGSLGNLESL